jgi:hypothetical protein
VWGQTAHRPRRCFREPVPPDDHDHGWVVGDSSPCRRRTQSLLAQSGSSDPRASDAAASPHEGEAPTRHAEHSEASRRETYGCTDPAATHQRRKTAGLTRRRTRVKPSCYKATLDKSGLIRRGIVWGRRCTDLEDVSASLCPPDDHDHGLVVGDSSPCRRRTQSLLAQSGSSDPRASDAAAPPPEDEAHLPVMLSRVKDLDVKPTDARTRLRPINDGKQQVSRDAARG